MSEQKRFPVMAEAVKDELYRTDYPEYERQRSLSWRTSQPTADTVRLYPGTIPWDLAERAYQEYSRRFGNGQSLERLAQRGGFGHDELTMFGLTSEEVCAHLERHQAR